MLDSLPKLDLWLPYDEPGLRRRFGAQTLEKARAYAASGAVIDLRCMEGATDVELQARVRGTQAQPYRAKVTIDAPEGEVEFRSSCTCPMLLDCKHVVAALLVALRQSLAGQPQHGGYAALDRERRKEIDSWMHRIDLAQKPAAFESPERVLYFLHAKAEYRDPLPLRIGIARLKKDGAWGQVRPYSLDTLVTSAAGFVSAEDRALAAQLAAVRRLRYAGGDAFTELCTITLRGIIATGRAYFDSPGETPLRLGDPRAAYLGWRVELDGTQRAALQSDTPNTLALDSAVPWYVDPRAGVSGPLDIAIPPRVLEELLLAPAIRFDDAALVSKALQERFGETPAIRAPQSEIVQEVQSVAPVPILSLKKRAPAKPAYYGYRSRAFDAQPPVPRIDVYLQFDYLGTVLEYGDRREDLRRTEGDRIVIVPRDTMAEKAALERIRRELPPHDADLAQWARFRRETAAALERDGWRVEMPAKLFGDVLDLGAPDARWNATLESRGDWFDVDLGVEVEGKRIALLPLLLDALPALKDPDTLKTEFVYVKRAGGVAILPAERIRTVLETFAELFEDPDFSAHGKLMVNRIAALGAARAFPEIEAGGENAIAVHKLAQRFAQFDGVAPAPVPQDLQATLRPYQHEGYRWLQFLREYGCGGILADDMGLGKTVQTIAHILREREVKRRGEPTLLVVPTSLVPNWIAEFERFAPSLSVLTWHGSQRKQRIEQIEQSDVVITTYSLLARDTNLLQRSWHIAILDEAQAIKNPQSKVAKAALGIRAEQRLCLTGTPMENHLGELWSLFNFVMPQALYDRRRFVQLFRTPIEKRGDAQRREALAKRIRPFVLRRTKSDVELQLPEKTEIIERIDLSAGQRDLYETVRAAMHDKVRREIKRLGIGRSRITVLDALLKLRQACCDPRLVKLEAAGRVLESAKLDWLSETLEQLAQEGRRTLVFSQFTSMIDLIKPRLDGAGIAYAELVGSTADRATPVRRFQSGEVPVFLISLKAGGTGLNLTAADTVIHYDPWWNPAVERQATDRAHRIGQEKPVFVYKLIAAGTVEEKILALQARKAELAGALFDAAKADSIDLTAADIDELFKP